MSSEAHQVRLESRDDAPSSTELWIWEQLKEDNGVTTGTLGRELVRSRTPNFPTNIPTEDGEEPITTGIGETEGVTSGLRRRRLPLPKNRSNVHNASRYAPQVRIEDGPSKTQFVQIARDIFGLERYLAEFYQSFGTLFHLPDIRNRLRHAEQTMAQQQNKDTGSADIGNLGRFCMGRLKVWLDKPTKTEHLRFSPVFRDDDEYIDYLRDGNPMVYWDLIMDMFHNMRRDMLNETHTTMMMNMLTSTFVLISIKCHGLQGHSSALPYETKILLETVGQRAGYLEGILRANIQHPGDIDLIRSSMLSFGLNPREDVSFLSRTQSISQNLKENTWYGIFACFIGSIMLSLIPGSVGFAKSWMGEEMGDIKDADFLYLIQSSIVSTFGNLATLMLLEKSDLHTPYVSVWAAVVIGTICNIVSIVIYPNFMPGWSALFGFIGTVSSASCVVISTYTAVLERNRAVKQKAD